MSIAHENKPFFDQRINAQSTFVLPGNHFVQSTGAGAISTLLGSCVAACIRDKRSQIGGLNHFLLPDAGEGTNGDSARYGVHAMELLINDILKRGASKADLEAKIFGGANVINSTRATTVGDQNGVFVQEYLGSESIPIVAKDLGGSRARRIYFFPATGRVSVLSVAQADRTELELQEDRIFKQAAVSKKAGAVELF